LRRRALGLVLIGAGWCGLAAGMVRQEPAATPVMDGATLFQARGCAQCHTIRGAGGHKGPDLSGVGRKLKAGPIEAQITNGGGAMPAFGDALSHDEIKALVKYLHKQRIKAKIGFAGSADKP
jgi:mono/diheme cytochrome c family protein